MRGLTNEDRVKAAQAKARKYPPKTASYTLKKLFMHMVDKKVILFDLAKRINQNPNNLSSWRTGKSAPNILAVEEMAAAVGLRLALVEVDEDKAKPVQLEPYDGVLTDQEREVMTALVGAWNAFLLLPVNHKDDATEFRHGIHRLQEKIFARFAISVENQQGGNGL